jgi:hypothetical protein
MANASRGQTRPRGHPRGVPAIADGGELIGAVRLGATEPHSSNKVHRENAEGIGIPFITSAAGEKPEGRLPWTAARSPSELADMALETTNRRIEGARRGREAQGGSLSEKSQTEEARGEDRRGGRTVLRWCAAAGLRLLRREGLERETAAGRR